MNHIPKKAAVLVSLAYLAAPALALAQQVTDPNLLFIKNLVVGTVNGVLVPILMAVAFIVFLWGVFKYYIKGADNESERSSGHQFIIWGVIGFTVILSLWGLVRVLQAVFFPGGAPSTTAPTYPTL